MVRLSARFNMFPRGPHRCCKPKNSKSPNGVPAQIDLPPFSAKAGRVSIRVVILMPILAPCPELERTQPPDVPARVDPFRQAGSHMEKAVDEHLEVERVHQPDGAQPKERRPSGHESRNQRDGYDGDLETFPHSEPAIVHIRTPPPNFGARPLIYPPDMRPPKASVARAGDVLRGIRFRMMVTMIGDPGHRVAGGVEDSEEYEDVLYRPIQFQGTVRKSAVETDGRSDAAERCDSDGYRQQAQTRHGKQRQPRHRQQVNADDVEQYRSVTLGVLQPGTRPGLVVD